MLQTSKFTELNDQELNNIDGGGPIGWIIAGCIVFFIIGVINGIAS